jgi:hypothetical protein
MRVFFGYSCVTPQIQLKERTMMADVAQQQGEGVPPQGQLMQMSMGFMISGLLRTAAELRLADHLAAGPKTAGELANVTGMHAPSLYRLLRTLSAHGLFAEDGEGRFALTPLGEPLRTGVPGSIWTSVMIVTGEFFAGPFSNLKYLVETG